MLGKRSWPAVGRLARPLRSSAGPRSGPLDHPCKMKMVSPPKNYDHMHGGGGVGLGIVVALDKSTTAGGEIILLAKRASISAQFSAHSSPIPVGSPAQPAPGPLDEEFTYVTCRHGPNKSATTRVYYDRGDGRQSYYGSTSTASSGRGTPRIEPIGGQKRGVFNINSPAARWADDRCSTPDFLSSCHLCRKGLHGKDIYMYRGEKAFCSAECRQRQITIDERKERCRSGISRSNDVVSTSPCCTGGPIFSTEIIAV